MVKVIGSTQTTTTLKNKLILFSLIQVQPIYEKVIFILIPSPAQPTNPLLLPKMVPAQPIQLHLVLTGY